MSTTFHLYHESTGVYLGSVSANTAPANSTIIEPTVIGGGALPVFDTTSNSWTNIDGVNPNSDKIFEGAQLIAYNVARYGENLINAGRLINGVQFRTNAESIQRLQLLRDNMEAGRVTGPVTYMTAGGDTLTFNSVADIDVYYIPAAQYVSDVLEASAQIQMNGSSVENLADDPLWPLNAEVLEA